MSKRNTTKILLIEDNLGDVRLIKEMFHDVGDGRYEIHMEGSVAESRRYLKIENPDVILLDLTLPDAVGFDSFKQVYGSAEHLPIIVLTGLDDRDLALKTLSMGAQDYLIKDKINPELMVRSVQYAIQRKSLIDKLQHMAFYDTLTDLPNRQLFVDRISMCFQRMLRQKDYIFAVFFLDLDKFKEVNDTFGHEAGDTLLVEVSKRIKESLRPTDTLSRFGGDEFGILLEDLQEVNNAVFIAKRILEGMKRPFRVEKEIIHCTPSIGITLNVLGYENAGDMLRDADIAMYRAKELGRNRFTIFELGTRERLVGCVRLEGELRNALLKKEFIAVYHPIISLETGKIVGTEALIRWQHPTRGLLSPFEFIGVAEESGLILQMGKWILHEACQQIGLWNQKLKRKHPLFVSVNISPKQFSQENLVEEITQTLKSVQMDPSLLKIELTETAILLNPDIVQQLLESLRSQHMQISLDDFGTGYSSLSHLYKFPIDFLKIDQSFTQKIDFSGGPASKIIGAIILLGRALNIDVIAEGIETTSQLKCLIEMRCAFGQGYLFSEPLEKEAMGVLLARDPNFFKEVNQISRKPENEL